MQGKKTELGLLFSKSDKILWGGGKKLETVSGWGGGGDCCLLHSPRLSMRLIGGKRTRRLSGDVRNATRVAKPKKRRTEDTGIGSV